MNFQVFSQLQSGSVLSKDKNWRERFGFGLETRSQQAIVAAGKTLEFTHAPGSVTGF
jgi:hypothetical protein